MKVSSTPQMPRTSMWRLYYKKPETKPYQGSLSHGAALLLAEVVIDEGEQHPPGQAARHALEHAAHCAGRLQQPRHLHGLREGVRL